LSVYSIQTGEGNYLVFKNSGLNYLAIYLVPQSHKMVTIVCPGPSSCAILMAPATLIPEERPKQSPSF
jgi:hypothetical protein